MPEGHEIHRWASLHTKAFAGRKVHVDSPNGGFADADILNDRKLIEVKAKGKHLGYHFGKDLTIHVHLGQFGDFAEGAQPMPEPKGALRLRIWTRADWLELRGPTDCRIFTDEQWQALEARLGPDLLDPKADPEPAFAKIQAKKTSIGALLMDQSVVSGIGNVYRFCIARASAPIVPDATLA
jgi:endonuclease-8